MRKNSTDTWATLSFLRICLAAFLLFASAYMLLPLLPALLAARTETMPGQLTALYAAFAFGMFAVGPFHAYLGDTYRRKDVFLVAVLLMAAATLGYAFAGHYLHVCLLALLQGAGFGMAVTGGITLAIDITVSSCRSRSNVLYAWASRLGMMVGACAGVWVEMVYGFRLLVYVASALLLCSAYFVSRLYVAFRAPIGVSVCNLDRFLLPRAWLPAVGVVLMAWVPGMWLPLLSAGEVTPIFFMAVCVVLMLPLTRLFVRLSHHCQRGTANTTCHLAADGGLLAGMAFSWLLADTELIHRAALLTAVLALLFFVLLAIPYYKKKRVR